MKTADGKRFKVLLVGDNILNLNIPGRILERDYHVLVGRSGQESLGLVRSSGPSGYISSGHPGPVGRPF
ncbi:MAG: hypothetical protein ACOCV7_03190 [Desulfonatronovibrionaceae bacterium]